jgi:HSP20 family protein
MEVVRMLMRTGPFGELDQLTQQFLGQTGSSSRPAVMPMDAYRTGAEYVIKFDLPGVDPASIDLRVERNALTVKAERAQIPTDGIEWQVAERPRGVFSRQLFLGEALDTERIEAHYDAGVLSLHIPLAEQGKPHKIEITSSNGAKQVTG